MKIIYGAAAVSTIIAATFAIWWAYVAATYNDRHKIIAFVLTAAVIILIVLYCIIFARLARRASTAEARSTTTVATEKADNPPKSDYSVKDSDPKIYLEFQDDRGTTITGKPEDEAYFVLINRGKEIAKIVCLEPIRLKQHLVAFPTFGYSISPTNSANIYPDIRTSGDTRPDSFDFFHTVFLEWDSYHNTNLHETSDPHGSHLSGCLKEPLRM